MMILHVCLIQTFREALNELEPTCQDEEDFLTKFFHLTVEHADAMMPVGGAVELLRSHLIFIYAGRIR